MTPPPLEELLRATLDRLDRQERRTAALEAAILDATPELVQTPTVRSAETPVDPPPRRAALDARPEPDRVVDSLDDAVWSVSPDGQTVLFAGGAAERFYGLNSHELQGAPGKWLDALPAEDRERLRAALARLPETGSFALEYRIPYAEGSRWLLTRGKLVRDRDGRPLRVDGTTTDVTRQARNRHALFAVLNGLGASSGTDFLTRLTRSLCAACEVRAALVAEAHPSEPGAAHAVTACVDGRDAEPFPLAGALARDLLCGGWAFAPTAARSRYPADPLLTYLGAEGFAAEPLFDSDRRPLGFLAVADGKPFPPEFDLRAVLKALAPRAAVELARRDDRGGREFAARLADAERRAADAEAAARRAAGLAAAGRVAAGLAHDFNNLLGVVAGHADLIRESFPKDDPRRAAADLITQTAQSVAAMNRQLLSFGRPPGPARTVPVDVPAAVRILEPLLSRLAGGRVALALDLAPGLPLICADPTQFDRVLLNLVLNARDAITGSGAVTIRASVATVEPGRTGWPVKLPPGEYVAVTVADTGCGMTPEVRAKMFDPFFTTKGDRGTGLGLATVWEAVTAAGGHVEVESEPGWGTQVRVYWPPLAEPRAR